MALSYLEEKTEKRVQGRMTASAHLSCAVLQPHGFRPPGDRAAGRGGHGPIHLRRRRQPRENGGPAPGQ